MNKWQRKANRNNQSASISVTTLKAYLIFPYCQGLLATTVMHTAADADALTLRPVARRKVTILMSGFAVPDPSLTLPLAREVDTQQPQDA